MQSLIFFFLLIGVFDTPDPGGENPPGDPGPPPSEIIITDDLAV